MQLEDYFDVLSADDILVRGTRVPIQTVLWDYLELGLFPEQIATRYRTLSIEQVYATITYYWHDRERVEAYLKRVERELDRQRREQNAHPSPAVERLRQLAQRQSAITSCG
jgi:uncharacterized protein (DUF433 family)